MALQYLQTMPFSKFLPRRVLGCAGVNVTSVRVPTSCVVVMCVQIHMSSMPVFVSVDLKQLYCGVMPYFHFTGS